MHNALSNCFVCTKSKVSDLRQVIICYGLCITGNLLTEDLGVRLLSGPKETSKYEASIEIYTIEILYFFTSDQGQL